tara:strand:- start:3147 stop:3554 length:408 start_codon:yes stop_codon:yes gene_type:complete
MARLPNEKVAALRDALPRDVDRVAFEEGTEAPFSHPLNAEKRDGEFHCRVCDEPLFEAAHKYDSGSGWPSFFKPATESGIETKTDRNLAMPRTEIHCANCGAHLGHVFPDGPAPTGQRYCVNGTVLDFKPEGEDK